MVSGDSKVVSQDFIDISTFILLNQFKGMEKKKIFESEIQNGQNFVLTQLLGPFESIRVDKLGSVPKIWSERSKC